VRGLFEFSSLRYRVPISGDTPFKSAKSPPQRRHLQLCGCGESHFQVGDIQFAARISVGEFGATVGNGIEADEAVRMPGKRGLVDAERVFLLAPKERQFDPFGQSLRSKLRRLMTGDEASTILGDRNASRVTRRT
jgi:hypothetical protein